MEADATGPDEPFPKGRNPLDDSKPERHHGPLEHYNVMPVEIKVRKGESMDRAIRRLKKRLDREGIIRDARSKRYFEKPSDARRRKRKVSAFNHMLRQRYENL